MVEMTDETWKAVGDRVRAARIAAGYRNRQALAKAITLPRFGKATLADVERGTRQLFEHEAVELSRVLERPLEWFYGGTHEGERTQLYLIERKIDAILDALRDADGFDVPTREDLELLPGDEDEDGAEASSG